MYDDQREIIALQREMLSISLSERLQKMARRCRNVWREEGKLNRVLALWLDRIPYARLIYATDVAGIQISANVFQYTVHQHSFGQDLSGRPYLNAELSADGFLLSEVYISKVDRRPCITAIQAVSRGTERLGFIAVDFEPLPASPLDRLDKEDLSYLDVDCARRGLDTQLSVCRRLDQ